MKDRIIVYIALLALILSTTSFRWPVENGKLTSTFGESRGDHFHDGIDLICSDDKIYPIEKGELLYYWDKSIFPLENEPGGGNYKVIKHSEDMYSVYMHLLRGVSSKKLSTPKEVTGLIGNSGHSGGKHLHFSILDLKKKESVNPYMVLPQFEDKKAPEIGDLYFHINDKYIMIKNNADNIRLTKHYPLLIKIVDTISGNERLGIYKLTVFFNRKQALAVDFKNIGFSEQGLTVAGKPFESLIDEKGYYKVEGVRYLEGDNTITVITHDFAGNKSEKTFTINVRLDMKQEI
ncbi:MAG: M23 family metallopeptidase [bacterium]|nr:M23 family metallopeptidase [bacterium]